MAELRSVSLFDLNKRPFTQVTNNPTPPTNNESSHNKYSVGSIPERLRAETQKNQGYLATEEKVKIFFFFFLF